MDLSQSQNPVPPAEGFGTIPNVAAAFGRVPQNAEAFGSMRNTAGDFRTVPQPTESRDKYTLSVREVSRMFEAAGVARSERSIVNWCRRDEHGTGKLDAYYDPNERKYFITPQSVELAIAEERAKAVKHGAGAERFRTAKEPVEESSPAASFEMKVDVSKVEALEAELRDLEIANRVKDHFIDELKRDREHFAEERKEFVSQLVSASRRVGELETRLLQIEGPES